MRCINKIKFLAVFLLLISILTGCISTSSLDSVQVSTPTDFFSKNLCVTTDDVALDQFNESGNFHATLLFDKTDQKVYLASDVHKRIYPASTTKIMTLQLALKYGNLSDTVKISKNAVSVPSDSSVAGLWLGDTLSLEDLLYGLMLPSGNDAAVAVAEHISGSVEDFVKLMNCEAKSLGATNTHFTSPHGYQNKEHYTTAYDLYLMLSHGIEDDRFCQIVSTASHEATITGANKMQRKITFMQSNQFVNGTYSAPSNVQIIGGKTGTTDEAGACLTLYVTDDDKKEYIAILMGAPNKPYLYDTMKSLLSFIPTL